MVKARVFVLVGLAGCGTSVSPVGGESSGASATGVDTTSTGVATTTDQTAEATSTDASTGLVDTGTSDASSGSASTGAPALACGCADDPDAFIPAVFERCERVPLACGSLELDCPDDPDWDPSTCLSVLPPLTRAERELLRCQLAFLQEPAPGEVTIALRWMGGYAGTDRTLLVETATEAIGFQYAYADIGGTYTVTHGGDLASEAAACAALEDPNAQLQCVWGSFLRLESLVCD